jgi:hypothetical protein
MPIDLSQNTFMPWNDRTSGRRCWGFWSRLLKRVSSWVRVFRSIPPPCPKVGCASVGAARGVRGEAANSSNRPAPRISPAGVVTALPPPRPSRIIVMTACMRCWPHGSPVLLQRTGIQNACCSSATCAFWRPGIPDELAARSEQALPSASMIFGAAARIEAARGLARVRGTVAYAAYGAHRQRRG